MFDYILRNTFWKAYCEEDKLKEQPSDQPTGSETQEKHYR